MSFHIKQNDTTPSIRVNLKNGSGDAVDLTNATCRFHMRTIGGSTASVDAAAQIISEATGVVQYNWGGTDTNTVGSYQGEFQVTYPDATVETFPNDGFVHIEILDDIA